MDQLTLERWNRSSKEDLIKEFSKLVDVYEQRISMLQQSLRQIGGVSDEARKKEMLTQVYLRDVAWAEALHKASGGQVVIQFRPGIADERSLLDASKVFLNKFEDIRQLPEKREADGETERKGS